MSGLLLQWLEELEVKVQTQLLEGESPGWGWGSTSVVSVYLPLC